MGIFQCNEAISKVAGLLKLPLIMKNKQAASFYSVI